MTTGLTHILKLRKHHALQIRQSPDKTQRKNKMVELFGKNRK